MSVRRVVAVLGVVIAVLMTAGPAAAQLMYEGKRHALVIGNAKYPTGALTNPGNDARAMGETLKRLGFNVEVKYDLGSEDMRRAIADFGRRLAAGGVGLFYFAGHGVQIDGANYLLPVDAQIRSEVDVDVRGVSVRQVLSVLGRADSAMNVLILDACRDNPFVRNFRSGASGLAAPDNIQAARNGGTMVAFATSPQSVAQDSKNDANGLYTSELTKAMVVPGLTLEGVFKRVRTEVSRRSNGQQVPQDWSQLMGDDFYLTPRVASLAPTPTPAPAPTPAPSRDDSAFELAFWDSIRDSKEKADYEAYLQKYPNGNFAPLAKERLRRLQTAALPTQPVVPPPTPNRSTPTPTPATNDAQQRYEQQRALAARTTWDRTRTTSDPTVLVRFIQQYPDSEFAPEARQRLKSMLDRAAALPAAPMTVQVAEQRKRAAEQMWTRAAQSDDPTQYVRFATQFPEYPAAATAKARTFELLDGYMKIGQPASAPQAPSKAQSAALPSTNPAPGGSVWSSFGKNYDWETRDFGTPAQATLRMSDFDQPTPSTIPGAKIIRTDELKAALDRGERMVLIDVSDAPPGHKTIPGANTLYGFGVGGDFKDQTQRNLAGALTKITNNNRQSPLVIFCVNPQCWKSYNVALRTAALGFPNVYWYRGGLDAWDQAGLRMAPAGGGRAGTP